MRGNPYSTLRVAMAVLSIAVGCDDTAEAGADGGSLDGRADGPAFDVMNDADGGELDAAEDGPAEDSGEAGLDATSGCVSSDPGAPGSWLWNFHVAPTLYIHGTGVAVDGSCRVVVWGDFASAVDFGGGLRTLEGDDPGFFILALEEDGTYRWDVTLAGSLDVGDVAVSDEGNVFIAASFTDTFDFGGGGRTADGIDQILVSLDADGEYLWDYQVQGSGDQSRYPNVAVTLEGNPILAGNAGDGESVDLGTGVEPAEMYLLALDSAGLRLWDQTWQVWGVDNVWANRAIAGADATIVILGGVFSLSDYSVDLGGGERDFGDPGGGVFALGVGSSGDYLWDVVLSAEWGDFSLDDAVVDADGQVTLVAHDAPYVDGYYDGSCSLMHLDTDYSTAWALDVDGTGVTWCDGLALDRENNILVAGSFTGDIDLGAGVRPGAGSGDLFVVSLRSSGDYRWDSVLGGSDSQHVGRPAVDPNGNTLIAGSFFGTTDFGGGPISNDTFQDLFVVKLHE